MDTDKNKLKKCKFCKTDIPKEAKICPNCRKSQGVSGCFVVAIILVALGMAALFGVTKMMSESPEKFSGTTAIPSECITKAEFGQIETGMTYQQVVAIIGSNGELMSEGDAGLGAEYITQIFMWKGADGISNANVTFQGGKVVGKAQAGLR